MTEKKAYLGVLKYHLGNMIHGYDGNVSKIPMKILRLYYKIAKERADQYIAKGKHASPAYIVVQGWSDNSQKKV